MRFLTIVFLLAGTQGHAQSVFVQKDPFFYKVEKDGKISFILGTMHAGISLQSFPKDIYETFNRCKTVAFEADRALRLKNDEQAIAAITKLPPGQSLYKTLSPAAIAKLNKLFSDDFSSYRPWVVASAIVDVAVKRLEKAEGISWSFDDAIDGYLLQRAKSRGQQTINYLDDEDKLKDFDDDVTSADLERLLLYPDPIAHEVECAKMGRNAYLAGDETGFERYYAHDCETPKMSEFMDIRTASWAPKIETMVNDGNVCMAFGAGHLYGPRGVLAQLDKQGAKVTRLNYHGIQSNAPETQSTIH